MMQRSSQNDVEYGGPRVSDKKIRPLSDSRPPVRPPGEPTQTEFMMANDLVNLPVADLARAIAFETSTKDTGSSEPNQQGHPS